MSHARIRIRSSLWLLLPGALLSLCVFGMPNAIALAESTADPGLRSTPPTSPEVVFSAIPQADPNPAESQAAPVNLQASVVKMNNYPIDLKTVLQLISEQNLPIAQSEKNTEIVRSRLRQRQVALLPNIDASYTQSRLEGGQQVFGGEVFTVIRETVQPQATASWTLYPGGRNLFEMLAARQRDKAAQNQLQETIQEQLARATEEYYRLLGAYQQKQVVLKSVAQAQAQVDLNQALVDAGRGIPLDLSRAQTNLAQQKTALLQAENTIMLAEQTLLNRLNLDPIIHLVPVMDDARQLALLPEQIDVRELIQEALLENPALHTLDQEIKALTHDYRAVRSDLLPSVTLRSYVNGTGPEWGELRRTEFRGLTINMNLLENLGLQVPFRMQEAKKIIAQKQLERQTVVRNIETQVMTAYLNSANLRSQVQAAQQEVRSAEESYDLAVGRFQAGYGINLDVLDAETALTTARSNLVQAVLDYNQAQVQLVEALGKISPMALLNGLSMQEVSHAQHP